MALLPVNIFPARGEPINLVLRMERDEPVREIYPPSPKKAFYAERGAPILQTEDATKEKVKRIVSYIIVSLGLLLLAGGFGLLSGHALKLVTVDPMIIQTTFICGLSAAMGGFSLQSSDYRGSITMSHPSLPFSFNMQQR